jgi:phosphoribosylformylglycinamidine (FGAM) synthase-like amidotransferase family enzyme
MRLRHLPLVFAAKTASGVRRITVEMDRERIPSRSGQPVQVQQFNSLILCGGLSYS